jgi:hypothetical protein
MQCVSIFLIFSEFPRPVCQVGWEPMSGVGSRVPHPQGTSMYFSPIFLIFISCSPSAKLDLNGFRVKIIHYMAAGRDNS